VAVTTTKNKASSRKSSSLLFRTVSEKLMQCLWQTCYDTSLNNQRIVPLPMPLLVILSPGPHPDIVVPAERMMIFGEPRKVLPELPEERRGDYCAQAEDNHHPEPA
jgi:hypothetical protein